MPEPLRLHRLARLYHDWFERLPQPVRADVLARGRRMAVRKGQRIFSRGDRPESVFIVLEGTLRLDGSLADGREAILDFFGPGAWLGETAVLDGLPRIHDAEAVEDGAVLSLSAADIEDLLARHPDFARALGRLVAFRLRTLLMAFQVYSLMSLEERLASRLLMLANLYGHDTGAGIEVRLHLSQETLGKLVGASRQRINQILAAWQQNHLVSLSQYGRIVVRDPSRLERLLPY